MPKISGFNVTKEAVGVGLFQFCLIFDVLTSGCRYRYYGFFNQSNEITMALFDVHY